LKVLSREYLGAGEYEAEIRQYRQKGFGSIPPNVLYKYNAGDAAYTGKLAPILKKRMVEDDVVRPYRDILIPAANALREINYRGIFIDRNRVQQLGIEWLPRWLEQEERLAESAAHYGWRGPRLNVRSPQQLIKFFNENLKIPVATTRKDVLEALEGEHEFIDQLLDFRHLDKMISTYVIGIQDDIREDGCVHPDAKLHGTRTGRLAYEKPPLMTIPKEYTVGEDLGRFKEIFRTRDPKKYLFGIADYNQAEVWWAYFNSGDQNMLRDLLSGDYHTQACLKIYKTTMDAWKAQDKNVIKKLRDDSKFVTFGIMYGRGAVSLGKKQLKCPTHVAQQYIDNWFAGYPDFKYWWDNQQRIAQENGELVSATGRKRRFHLMLGDGAWKAMKQAVNFPIQSASSDMCLSALVELHYRLRPLDSYVLFTVHDSILFEINKYSYEDSVRTIVEVMTTPRFPPLQTHGVPVELKVGESWGSCQEVDLGKYLPAHT
jgi:DNA polymerase-1